MPKQTPKGAATDPKQAARDLKRVIEDARKGAVFGLSLDGSNSSWPVIRTSRTKKGPAMLQKAKQDAGGGVKTGHGTLSYAGNAVHFHFSGETDPPTGCLRILKTFFNKFDQVKVFVIDARGRIQSDDSEQVETVDHRRAARMTELAAIYKSLRPRLAAAPDLDARFNRLKGVFEGLLRKTPLPEDEFDTLLQMIADLGQPPPVDPSPVAPINEAPATPTVLPYATAVDDLGPTVVIDPNSSTGKLQSLVTLYRSTRMKLDAVIKNDPSIAESVKRLDDVFERIVKSDLPDLKLAAQIVRHAASLVPKSSAALRSVERHATGAEPASSTISGRLSEARSKLGKVTAMATVELRKLRDQITFECDGLPGAPRVARSFDPILKKITNVSEALSGEIEEAINCVEEADRRVSAAKVGRRASEIARLIGENEQLAALDANPFLPVAAHSRLVKSLHEIGETLSR